MQKINALLGWGFAYLKETEEEGTTFGVSAQYLAVGSLLYRGVLYLRDYGTASSELWTRILGPSHVIPAI